MKFKDFKKQLDSFINSLSREEFIQHLKECGFDVVDNYEEESKSSSVPLKEGETKSNVKINGPKERTAPPPPSPQPIKPSINLS